MPATARPPQRRSGTTIVNRTLLEMAPLATAAQETKANTPGARMNHRKARFSREEPGPHLQASRMQAHRTTRSSRPSSEMHTHVIGTLRRYEESPAHKYHSRVMVAKVHTAPAEAQTATAPVERAGVARILGPRSTTRYATRWQTARTSGIY